MKIRKAKLRPEIMKFINSYRKRDLDDLRKLRVRWAYGKNLKHSLRYRSELESSEEYQVYSVNLRRLIEVSDFGEMGHAKLNPLKLFNGVNERDYRVAHILEHWSKGKYVDPPELALTPFGKIAFGDGRHRTVTAFHLGKRRIPVIVHTSLIRDISKAIDLKELS